jgi:DNA repair exonuclease SbcCD nuclease subunit
MKFIHIGDTHIGAVYKNETRNEDVKDSFRQVVDSAVREGVDFIVHAGDLFNEGNPSLDALLFATDQLNKLKTAGIKMFIVPGSHDVGIGEKDSILELFDRNGLLVNLNSKRYIKNSEESFKLYGETYKNAFICGVQGKRSRVENDIFKRLSIDIDSDAWIKIFIFHHTISALGEQFKDLDTESLPKDFDYYAAGHWHGHKDGIKYDRGIIQYPGSTEYCDEKEIVDNPNRGFYLIEYDNNGIRYIEYKILKTRQKDIFELSASGRSADDINDEILSKLTQNDGKILVVKITGKMLGKRSELNIAGIRRAANAIGYSYSSINTAKLTDNDDVSIATQEVDLTRIEADFLKQRNYNAEQIQLAKILIDAMENGMDAHGIKKKAEEWFEKYDNKRN